MIGKKSRNIVVTQIRNILVTGNKQDRDANLKYLRGKLVQTGKVPSNEINKLVAGRVDIESLDENYLCLIYKTLAEFNDQLQPTNEYFTDIEIQNAEQLVINRISNCYPLEFNNVIQTTENGKEFKFFISVQQLYNMSINGILKIVEGMQRESETIYYRGKIENHVAYNDSVARKIAQSVLDREYHPTDEIKIHCIEDGNCDYVIDGDKITIKSGDLVLLDGQHRVRAFEYALNNCPDLYLMLSVNLSFGSEEYAQSIIEQHERRQPIKKQVLEAFRQTEENDVFKIFSNNKLIEKEFKFVDIPDAERRGAGFIIRSEMIKSIKRYYKPADLKTKEQREVAKWLVDFFDTLYLEFEDDITNFQTVRKTKWNVCSYAYDGLVFMSKKLFDLDVDDKMKLEIETEILKSIDFSQKLESSNKEKECKNIIEKVVNEYVQ